MSTPQDGINALATELLCKIFGLTIDRFGAPKGLYGLMLVCRMWRDCIESSPSLWTYISADYGLSHVRRALERSKGAMVDLFCWWSYGNSSTEREAFMIDAGPHVARWRSLEMSLESALPSWSGNDELGPVRTTQPPRLEMLHLSLTSPRWGPIHDPDRAVTLFGGAPAPPTLKALMLYQFPAAFEPLGLSGLVSLGLSKVFTISTPQLFEILRRCPELESLDLAENWKLVAIGAKVESNIELIELPKLVSLSLKRMDYGGANCILSNIRIPNPRCHVSIEGDIRTTRETVLAILFTPDIAHILHPTMPSADIAFSVIRVEIGDGIALKVYFRGIELLFMMNRVDEIQEILRWFADRVGGCRMSGSPHTSRARSIGSRTRSYGTSPPGRQTPIPLEQLGKAVGGGSLDRDGSSSGSNLSRLASSAIGEPQRWGREQGLAEDARLYAEESVWGNNNFSKRDRTETPCELAVHRVAWLSTEERGISGRG